MDDTYSVDWSAHEVLTPVASTGFTYATYGASARRAEVSVDGGSIRVWRDGTAPSSSVGHLYADGSHFTIAGRGNLSKFRCIQASGTAKVHVDYGN